MQHHHHWQPEFSEHFPFLNEEGLHGGFTYGDAQTDDARLVLELVAGAVAAGGGGRELRKAGWPGMRRAGKVCGATVRDVESAATLHGARQTMRGALPGSGRR